MKKLANLRGVKALGKTAQKAINGGNAQQLCCDPAISCCISRVTASCSGTGGPQCQYLFFTGGSGGHSGCCV